MLCGECIQIEQELLCVAGILGINDLVKRIYIYLRDIVVTCVQAGNETEQSRIAVNCVILDVNQTSVMRDIKLELIALCDADNAALLFLDRSIYQINNRLGLAGAGSAHNEFYHCNFLLA